MQGGVLPVVFGHCIIVPLAHVVCTRDLDEDALAEITRFKLGLEKMCAAKVRKHTTVGYLSFGPIEKYFMFFVTSACTRPLSACTAH